MGSLTVVITSLDDPEETNLTIRSIRATAGENLEIIVVDDGSDPPLVIEDRRARLVRNEPRLGVGPSRHLGVSLATSEYVLLTDCHMRFEPGWYERALERISGRPTTVHCATCLGLHEGSMELAGAAEYNGAYLCLYDPETNTILEGKWAADRPSEDDYELSCMMGAAYFVPREFFLRIRGLAGLKLWGSDEPYLSLKTWLAGGEVRMMKTVRIGHKFRSQAPYFSLLPALAYNKMRVIETLLDPPLARTLVRKFNSEPVVEIAKKMIENDRAIIEEHRAYYGTLFVRDPSWFFTKFNIPVPPIEEP